jgi:hypothetical protein
MVAIAMEDGDDLIAPHRSVSGAISGAASQG